MTKQILFTSLAAGLMLVGCDDAGRRIECINGCNAKPLQIVQLPGEVVELPAETSQIIGNLELIASRSYGPSKFNNSQVVLVSGTYTVPQQVELVGGAAGTGWTSLSIGGLKFCYQGNGLNNSQPGTAFVLKHMRSVPGECFLGTDKLSPASQVTITGDALLSLVVNGGGLSGSLQAQGTTVRAIVDVQATSVL